MEEKDEHDRWKWRTVIPWGDAFCFIFLIDPVYIMYIHYIYIYVLFLVLCTPLFICIFILLYISFFNYYYIILFYAVLTGQHRKTVIVLYVLACINTV